MPLPAPEPDAILHSAQLSAHIRQAIAAAGGWLPFDRYMALALYAPGLGYYSAGARKFGAAGDFVTAPEMTPLFGRCLARQVADLLPLCAPVVLEAGAGSGRLATDLLLELERLDCLPDEYAILDLSAELRERQRQTLARAVPHLLARVRWLDTLPAHFSGVVVANEVLDAMPVQIVCWQATEISERGVAIDETGAFVWQERPADGRLLRTARHIAERHAPPPGYVSEISLAAAGWAASWGDALDCGALLLIDYGFAGHTYYHSQRSSGTLMCHYRHHAHDDPFYLPGLQDITAHVDFTAITAAGHAAGLEVLGYASQGQFLLNCGLLDLLAGQDGSTPASIAAAGAANRLILPHEMGELFKVLALGRGIDAKLSAPLRGFTQGDHSHRL